MLLKNSLKQMGRIKAKTFTFMLLIIFASTFLSIGINLWIGCNENLKEYEKVFKTIGVVNQKENTMEVSEHWDASTKKYTYRDNPIYDSILPLSLLDFESSNYIIKPEQRPYYGSYCPNLEISPAEGKESMIRQSGSFLEFVPYEDCIPTEPVKIKVTRVLWGISRKEGEDVWLCDQFNPTPGSLKGGVTYISLVESPINPFYDKKRETLPYAIPNNLIISTQKNKIGESIHVEEVSAEKWAEVTDNFYETKEGRKWINSIEAYDRFSKSTIPVVPTSSTSLLIGFHQGNTFISDGRDITNEEYEKGERVCMLAQDFANRNNLKIGDSINLQLYFSNYEKSSSLNYFPSGSRVLDFGLLNADGEPYPIFEKGDYKIVGIYSTTDKLNYPTGYEMGYNAVIIPSSSVKNSDENNIVAYGPMKGYTTSFQIPNGTSKEYFEKLQSLGLNNLEINFYDGGYEKLASGMKNLRFVAMILMIVSSATTLAILFFFLFLIITKQKKRTAIERSLGMSKKDCTVSLIYGIIFVISFGGIIGSFTGFTVTEFIMSKTLGREVERYSTEFSNWVNNSDKAANLNTSGETTNLLIPILLCFVILTVSLLISMIYIKRNLNAEPLELLSGNEE